MGSESPDQTGQMSRSYLFIYVFYNIAVVLWGGSESPDQTGQMSRSYLFIYVFYNFAVILWVGSESPDQTGQMSRSYLFIHVFYSIAVILWGGSEALIRLGKCAVWSGRLMLVSYRSYWMCMVNKWGSDQAITIGKVIIATQKYLYFHFWTSVYQQHRMHNTRKGLWCSLWTMQAQISLGICQGWSGPSLPTYRINGYCSICRQTENAQSRLHWCACWSGRMFFAYGIRAFFPRCATYVFMGEIKKKKSTWITCLSRSMSKSHRCAGSSKSLVCICKRKIVSSR